MQLCVDPFLLSRTLIFLVQNPIHTACREEEEEEAEQLTSEMKVACLDLNVLL